MYSKREYPNRIHLDIKGCDCICLFSGGLDSFCGAIKLLEEGKSPCLVGHNEYPKLKKKQGKLCFNVSGEIFESESAFYRILC